jgi:hypothetical protein
VIIPVKLQRIREQNVISMTLVNVGPGVAMNTWGTVGMKGQAKHYSSVQSSFLVPKIEGDAIFEIAETGFPSAEFNNCPIFPLEEDGISYDIRLMLTYRDVFDNKFLVIFDHSREFGWKQFKSERVKETMDEVAKRLSWYHHG